MPSNDFLLSSLLYEFAQTIRAEVMCLRMTCLPDSPRLVYSFAPGRMTIISSSTKTEPIGDYVIECNGEVVATGGFLLHYNKPFADLYMEVREDCRGRGIGSFLVQEIKKQCYLAGRVPAARCDIRNTGSRATLIKAGLQVCGFMLMGEIRRGCAPERKQLSSVL